MTEAEQGVLGCVLIDSSSLYDVYNKLKPEMFASEFCQDCYAEMLAMYDRGESINTVSLSMVLENHKWEPEFIANELKDCAVAAPTTTMIKSYADVVIKDYRARMAKELFQRVSFAPKDIDNTIAEILMRFEELQGNMNIRSKSLKQIVSENKDNYFNERVGEGVIKTGFYKLDDCLGGLEGGDVTIVGARPAVGKSAFVTQVIGNVASKGYRVGYFNLEMNENQVYERFVSRLAELSLTRVRRAKQFLGGEQEAFEKANHEMSGYDVIISTGSKTDAEIKAECRHQNFDLIIIDYLQLVIASKRCENRTKEVGYVSRALKALATELNVPVIALSQLSRNTEYKPSKKPTLADLREAGDIEQDASNIIFLWNLSDKHEQYKGLSVAKQRMGCLMDEGLKFDGEHMKFIERLESFEKFINFVKDMDKGTGLLNVNEEITPFGDWD